MARIEHICNECANTWTQVVEEENDLLFNQCPECGSFDTDEMWTNMGREDIQFPDND